MREISEEGAGNNSGLIPSSLLCILEGCNEIQATICPMQRKLSESQTVDKCVFPMFRKWYMCVTDIFMKRVV